MSMANKSESRLQLPIGITMGDPAGIGPEIVAKLFAEGIDGRAVVYGDLTILRRAIAIVGANLRVRKVVDARGASCSGGTIDVIPLSWLPEDFPFGCVEAAAGRAAYDYLNAAIYDARAGETGALVTAPIHKGALSRAGIRFPGHTEILSHQCGGVSVAMMLANGALRVLLVTIHVSLAEAIRSITLEAELRAIKFAQDACLATGINSPRIAVAGLNPHAGEGGLFGSEDGEIIALAVAKARACGIDVTGPWPGDTVFMRARAGEFDIVVAQYHDQGLIPLKYLGLEDGVSVTVGLPFPRTSVDHGTAFDIAGTGRASHASLRAAFRHAQMLRRFQASQHSEQRAGYAL